MGGCGSSATVSFAAASASASTTPPYHHPTPPHPTSPPYHHRSNKNGQIGTNSGVTCSIPERVPIPISMPADGGVVTQVAAGLRHTVAVTSSCRVYAWGSAGSFRFVSPVSGTIFETYARSREPKIMHQDLMNFPGAHHSTDPKEVISWEGCESHSKPRLITVSCSFSRSMSVTLLEAKFEDGALDVSGMAGVPTAFGTRQSAAKDTAMSVELARIDNALDG